MEKLTLRNVMEATDYYVLFYQLIARDMTFHYSQLFNVLPKIVQRTLLRVTLIVMFNGH